MKQKTTAGGSPPEKTRQPYDALNLTKESGMTEKIIADAVALGEGQPPAGWALLARDIAIEEAERQRLVQQIPDFRAQAITALAYWTSLSRRVDSLNITKNLLIHLRDGSPPETGGITTPHKARTHD